MPSSKKFLADGSPNPNYKGDRHASKKDRHTTPRIDTRKGNRHRTKFTSVRFIAWDGEGVTRKNGRHDYCYLASSEGDEMLRVKGTIPTVECFELLLHRAELQPGATHVVFSGSYDVNMMLVDVPRPLLEKVYRGETVEWGDYAFSYVPRKEFKLKRWGHTRFIRDPKTGKSRPNFEASITLWDVFGFFQGSFVKALKEYGFDAATIDYIKNMKVQRGTFTAEMFKRDVVPYCQKELELLVKLMYKLKANLESASLSVTRWDGAGALASALLKREGIKAALGNIPYAVDYAASFAYSGGRIECFQYGHHAGTVYHYDINSAYPAAALRCPDLSTGRWHEVTTPSGHDVNRAAHTQPFSLWHVNYNFPDGWVLYPFSNRDILGQISFPQSGQNWVWGIELQAVFDTVPDAWRYITCSQGFVYDAQGPERYPFDFLPALFAQRAIWKLEGNGAEKALKLAINSVYGKLIQKVGHRDPDGKIQKPPYFQLEWAGYITATTRAKLFAAAIQKPEAIICIATDGIFSTEPLDLPISKDLGAWDYSEHTSMTIVTSGVYFYTNPDGSRKDYYRGFDEGTISEEKVLSAWRNHQHSLPTRCTRFITLGSALVSTDRFALWRTWHTAERELALDFVRVAKRGERVDMGAGMAGPHDDFLWGNGSPADGLRHTYPRTAVSVMSKAYTLPWNDPDEQETIDGVSVDIFYKEVEDSYA